MRIGGVLDDVAVCILLDEVSLTALGHLDCTVRYDFLDLVDEFTLLLTICRIDNQVAQLDDKAVEVRCMLINRNLIGVCIGFCLVVRKHRHYLSLRIGLVCCNLIFVGSVSRSTAEFGFERCHLECELLVFPNLTDVLLNYSNLRSTLGLFSPVGSVELVDDILIGSFCVRVSTRRIFCRERVDIIYSFLITRVIVAVTFFIRVFAISGDDKINRIFGDGVVDPKVIQIGFVGCLICRAINICVCRKIGPGNCKSIARRIFLDSLGHILAYKECGLICVIPVLAIHRPLESHGDIAVRCICPCLGDGKIPLQLVNKGRTCGRCLCARNVPAHFAVAVLKYLYIVIKSTVSLIYYSHSGIFCVRIDV